MLKLVVLIVTFGFVQPVFAGECPVVTGNSAEKDRLHQELVNARSEMEGQILNDQIWRIWTTAPDKASQELLDLGRERIRIADYERAEKHFNDLIEYCPHYAEGWNQRAYVRFLQQNYDASLNDIIVVLDLEPRHFGALSGRATVLLSMGRVEVGHNALRAALKINPWLSERHLLPKDKEI